MKKSCLIVISIIVSILVGVGIGFAVYKLNHKEEKIDYKILSLGQVHNSHAIGNTYKFATTYEEYENFMGVDIEGIENKLTKEDFEKNDYLLVDYGYDICSKDDVKLSKYELKDGVITVTFDLVSRCNECEEDLYTSYYALLLPKGFKTVKVEFKDDQTDC